MNLTPDQYHTIRPGDTVTQKETEEGATITTTMTVDKVYPSTDGQLILLESKQGYHIYLTTDSETSEVTLERPTLPSPTAPFIIAYEVYGEATTTNGEGWNMVQKRNGHYVILFKGILGPREYRAEEITQYDVAEFAPVTP